MARAQDLPTNDAWPKVEPAYVRYALLVDDRAAWRRAFDDEGLELGEWFDDPIHPAGSSHAAVGYASGQCPHAERLARG